MASHLVYGVVAQCRRVKNIDMVRGELLNGGQSKAVKV